MKELKDILSHYTQEPPAGSWDRLCSRLDLVAPAGSATPADTPPAAGAAKGAAVSSLTKAIVSIGAALLTAAAITTAVIIARHHNPAEVPVSENESVILTDSAQTEDAIPVVEAIPTESPVPSPAQHDDSRETSTEPVSFPSITSPDIAANAEKSPTPTGTAPASIVSQGVTAAPQPAISHVTIPQVTLVRPQQEDPALQDMDNEAMNWQQPSKIEIPNVFTPNGDGYNDFFVIAGIENCVKRELYVYDRNGRAVYRSHSYENTWSGDNCPDGTYTYQFLYSQNGISQELRGTVTIVRK